MPDDVAIEKVQVLEKLGAKVERVKPGQCIARRRKPNTDKSAASIVDEKQVSPEFINSVSPRPAT